ncbi:hypothetical protein GCM10023107_33120 [Actinoplanes octamycinicus]|nr:hypothetical protein Aoc01nite_47260 [Actinoplanes octamycinicus]
MARPGSRGVRSAVPPGPVRSDPVCGAARCGADGRGWRGAGWGYGAAGAVQARGYPMQVHWHGAARPSVADAVRCAGLAPRGVTRPGQRGVRSAVSPGPVRSDPVCGADGRGRRGAG